MDFENNTFEVYGECGVNWHAFGSIRVFTKYSILLFTSSTLSSFKISVNLESRFQEKSMLDFGSNFGQMWNFVKCNLLPFLFTYFDLLSTKNSEQVLRTIKTSIFERMFTLFCDFGMFLWKMGRITFSKNSELTVCRIFQWLMKRRGNNLIKSSQ